MITEKNTTHGARAGLHSEPARPVFRARLACTQCHQAYSAVRSHPLERLSLNAIVTRRGDLENSKLHLTVLVLMLMDII